MKRLLSLMMVFAVFATLISCQEKRKPVPEIDVFATTEESTTQTLEPQKSQIIVFADDSIVELMNIIKQDYESKYANTNVIYQFEASESLKNKIVNIADCDVFISASPEYLDQIDVTKGADINVDMFDFIEPNTRTVVFKGNSLVDSKETYEACVIRIGLNIEEAKRFLDFLTKY